MLSSSVTNRKDVLATIGIPNVQEFDSKAESRANQLKDPEFNEDSYITDFDEFSKNQKYMEVFDDLFKDYKTIDADNSDIEVFDRELQAKGENTIFESLVGFDKTKVLKTLIKKTKLNELSGEIMNVVGFVKAIPYLSKEKKDAAIIFLTSLDYLVKGIFIHWQITLSEQSEKTNKSIVHQKLKEEALIFKDDIKFNVLIGDQFHAKAFHMVTRLGKNDLSKILTIIEESFAKIIFRDGYNGNQKHNLKKLYKDFYNYLPQFFGHGFKGIAIISEMGASSIDKSFKLGIEYGF